VRIRRAEKAEIKEKNCEWQRKEVERERQSCEEQKKDPGPYRGPVTGVKQAPTFDENWQPSGDGKAPEKP
jgi:hypothetical protein